MLKTTVYVTSHILLEAKDLAIMLCTERGFMLPCCRTAGL